MSTRKVYCFLSLFSLALGTCIYILFRENSYIGIITGSFQIIHHTRELAKPLSSAFIKFYFPDFLWGFSLCCGLLAIYVPNIKGCLICVGTTFSCGCVWELLQSIGFVSGTGDLYDMLMYFLAGVLCIIINIVRSR